jgi:hypothetical protein
MEGDEVNKIAEAKNGNRPPRGNGGLPPGRGGPPPTSWRSPFGGPGGGALFGKGLYYISFLGAPFEKTPCGCSLADITWRSTSRSMATAVF